MVLVALMNSIWDNRATMVWIPPKKFTRSWIINSIRIQLEVQEWPTKSRSMSLETTKPSCTGWIDSRKCQWLNRFSLSLGFNFEMNRQSRRSRTQASRRPWWTCLITCWILTLVCSAALALTFCTKSSTRSLCLASPISHLRKTKLTMRPWIGKNSKFIQNFPQKSKYLLSRLPKRSLPFAKETWSWTGACLTPLSNHNRHRASRNSLNKLEPANSSEAKWRICGQASGPKCSRITQWKASNNWLSGWCPKCLFWRRIAPF